MKKKGFTLVELLAVIVILGIIALIAVPQIFSSVETAKRRAKEVQKDIIINATKSYVAELSNPLTKLDDDGNAVQHYVTVTTLIDNKYIDGDDSESIANSEFGDKCVLVEYSSKYNQFLYELSDCE